MDIGWSAVRKEALFRLSLLAFGVALFAIFAVGTLRLIGDKRFPAEEPSETGFTSERVSTAAYGGETEVANGKIQDSVDVKPPTEDQASVPDREEPSEEPVVSVNGEEIWVINGKNDKIAVVRKDGGRIWLDIK
jgi:hypothetical protein